MNLYFSNQIEFKLKRIDDAGNFCSMACLKILFSVLLFSGEKQAIARVSFRFFFFGTTTQFTLSGFALISSHETETTIVWGQCFDYSPFVTFSTSKNTSIFLLNEKLSKLGKYVFLQDLIQTILFLSGLRRMYSNKFLKVGAF